MAKIIVIAAHPDDEVLGCGGTLLKHKANGDEIFWIIITGVSEEYGYSKERIESRTLEIKKIRDGMGFSAVHQLGYPAMGLDSTIGNKMIPQLSDLFQKIQPEVIYLVNRSDAHSDHRITFDAVMACTKSFRYPFIKKVLMYECLSETEFTPALPEKIFLPNYFVDVSLYMKRKLELMEVYASEVGAHPFPRSIRNIEALAVYRGASAGVEYAEAFQLLKLIDK